MEKVLGAEGEEQLAAKLSQLSAWQEGSEGPSCSHHDPYADSSIIFGSRPALPMDQEETRRLLMKRKVLRHRPDGRVEVSDETLNIKPDTNAKPRSLGPSRTFTDDTISKGELETSSGALDNYLHHDDDDDDWFLDDSPCSLIGDFGSDTISEYSIPGAPATSYIARQADKRKRTDRVAKFNKYKEAWERYSFPGEDPHQSLRWAVRRQMLQQGPPCRVPKRPSPNTYVVPTMKKRNSLRWGVRWDMAHHLMPHRNTSS